MELIVTSALAATVRLATPLIFAAIGGVVSERAGVLNIALEGMMLAGAFGYFVGALWTGSVAVAVVMAIAVGAALALVLVALSVRIAADQVIVGLAINLAALGGTSFLYRSAFGLDAGRTVVGMGNIHVPLLHRIPVVGTAIFGQAPLTYVAFAIVLVVWLGFRFTRPGIWVRAVGENPDAADAVGIHVLRVRTAAVAVCGALCGLGGAFLLSQIDAFTENMVSGAGFIALAAVIFGRWEPGGALLACLFFALFQSLQTVLQVSGVEVPYQLLLMAPYVVTVVVLAGFVGRAVPPAADGKPYLSG